MEAAFLYDARLSRYQLSESHPFKPLRLELAHSLLQDLGLLKAGHEQGFSGISEGLLLRVHSPDYVEAVKRASAGKRVEDAAQYGLGTADNPVFPGMHEAVLRVASATVTALELVASGRARRAVNLAGGLHHAMAGRASGFCVYNDLALALTRAVDKYGLRVAYVDVDAHHGDGVQQLFYERAEVMTISLHESGHYLFPGSGHSFEIGRGEGRGMSVNLPLEPFTEDTSFLEVFEAVVPEALRAFGPDLIVLQAGADMHRYDPLADLALSNRAMAQCYRRVCDLADELCGGRLVATGGGGYDTYRTVPRAWALLWAALSRRDIGPGVPQRWLERWQGQSEVLLPRTILDDTSAWEPVARREEIRSHNRTVAARLLETLRPIWAERFPERMSRP